jgi:hypothetical protein
VPSDNQNRGVNRTKPDRWKADILRSVDMYNDWFLKFAPAAYRETRIKTTKEVESTLVKTENLTDMSAAVLKQEPSVLPTLRMSTCPPLAVDRLIGLAGLSRNLVGCMEEGSIPLRMNAALLEKDLRRLVPSLSEWPIRIFLFGSTAEQRLRNLRYTVPQPSSLIVCADLSQIQLSAMPKRSVSLRRLAHG